MRWKVVLNWYSPGLGQRGSFPRFPLCFMPLATLVRSLSRATRRCFRVCRTREYSANFLSFFNGDLFLCFPSNAKNSNAKNLFAEWMGTSGRLWGTFHFFLEVYLNSAWFFGELLYLVYLLLIFYLFYYLWQRVSDRTYKTVRFNRGCSFYFPTCLKQT